MNRRNRQFLCMLTLALVSASCGSMPRPMPLTSGDFPAAWSEPVIPSVDVWPKAAWWRALGNTELAQLIEVAKQSNLDLAATAARVLQAEAQTNISRVALFPTIGIGGNGQIQGGYEQGMGVRTNAFGIAAVASYELDFWGVARNNIRSAENLLRSTRYGQETVAVTVTSNVAMTFFDVLALRQRIAIARANLALASRVLEAIQKRSDNGLSSPLGLAQQQALVAGQAAEIPTLEQQEREALFALALLLGRAPEALAVRGGTLEGMVIPSVAPGLPSELLSRRPDIAQAEANLLAANANVAAARAAFYPQIALTASGGLASGAISAVTDGLTAGTIAAATGGTGLIYGIGASLLQTIFDGGRRQGAVDFARAQEIELVANYRSTVFRAFSDVETALSQLNNYAVRERLKAEQVEKAAAAFDISDHQYREGLVDLFAVVQTQQTLFSAQDELVQFRLARLQSGIGLYKALGGGWNESPTLNTLADVGKTGEERSPTITSDEAGRR